MNGPMKFWYVYFISIYDTYVMLFVIHKQQNIPKLVLVTFVPLYLFPSSSFYLYRNHDNRELHCQYNFNFTVASVDITIWDIHGYGYVRLFTSFS